jgi:hypothetical protein
MESRADEFGRRRVCVRDFRAPIDPHALALLPENARIQWRAPLEPLDFERVVDWLEAHPAASLRLYGGACEQISALAGRIVPSQLDLETKRLPAAFEALPAVTDLGIDGAHYDPSAVLAAFPNLHVLRAVLRGAMFDAETLAAVPKLERFSLAEARLTHGSAVATMRALRVVELCDVVADIDDVNGVLRAPGLRALRLRGISGLRSVDALARHRNLRVLALDGLLHLESLRVLMTLPSLESLDLVGLWQFELADVDFLGSMTSLRRFRIDIGGRRKNVEIYKQLRRCAPEPFDLRDV